MADNYGVLGTGTALTVGTTTVYTCPVGKAAKFKLQIYMQFGSNSDVGIFVNGVEIARTGAMTAANYNWTARTVGLFGAAAGAAKPDGLSAVKTVAPSDGIYYLSTGQTVQYVIATANMQVMNVQVVGTEVAVV